MPLKACTLCRDGSVLKNKVYAVRYVVMVNGKVQDAEIEEALPRDRVMTALNFPITNGNNRNYRDVMFDASRTSELEEYVKVTTKENLKLIRHSNWFDGKTQAPEINANRSHYF